MCNTRERTGGCAVCMLFHFARGFYNSDGSLMR